MDFGKSMFLKTMQAETADLRLTRDINGASAPFSQQKVVMGQWGQYLLMSVYKKVLEKVASQHHIIFPIT